MRFLITGLPRSRTAWWSAMTTTAVSKCLHEPLGDVDGWDELAEIWDSDEYRHNGVSDSGMAPYLGRALAELEPRTLIVERDIGEVERSCVEYFFGYELDRPKLRRILISLATELSKWHEHPLVKVVKFETLRRPDVVRECFDWLLPGTEARFNHELLHMNVQVNLPYAIERIRCGNSFLA